VLQEGGDLNLDDRRYSKDRHLRQSIDVSALTGDSPRTLHMVESQISFSIFGRHDKSWSAYSLNDGVDGESVDDYAAEDDFNDIGADPASGSHNSIADIHGAPRQALTNLSHTLEKIYEDWKKVVQLFVQARDEFEVQTPC
jgi:hypothetical protein